MSVDNLNIIHVFNMQEGSDELAAAQVAAMEVQSIIGGTLGEDGDTYLPQPGDNVLYFCTEDEDIVSLLVWTDRFGNCWVCTAWTREDFRRQGLYRRLYEKLILTMGLLSKPIGSIGAGVVETNEVSIKVHKALGMKAEFTIDNVVHFIGKI